MLLAFQQVAPSAGVEGVADRVMLFTDAQPNVGSTGINSFVGMTEYYAEAGIGASVFGVGLDLGAELADAISRTRGGNYFYLADNEAIRTIFDDDFDYMVTPLAYDLDVEMELTAGLTFNRGYGAPVEGVSNRLEFGASTLFLSSRSGGMGAEIIADGQALSERSGSLGEMRLSFESHDGVLVEEDVTIHFEGGTAYDSDSAWADDLGVYKMAVLVAEFHALQAGADFCERSLTQEEASARISESVRRLVSVSEELEDEALAAEVVLMEQLIDNLAGGSCW